MVKMGVMVAISVAMVYLVHFPIFPAVPFLEYDPADISILIGTFAFGPEAGLVLTVVTAVVQGLTVSAGSGLTAGMAAMAVVMVGANLLITPMFMGVSKDVVWKLMPFIIGFNVIKAGINGAVTFLLYKRIAMFLRK